MKLLTDCSLGGDDFDSPSAEWYDAQRPATSLTDICGFALGVSESKVPRAAII